MATSDQNPTVRVMTADEYPAMRALAVAAFENDESIGDLLDQLRESWAWRPDLAFVAESQGELVGQVLYSNAILDSPDRLVDVLLLSPVGVRTDVQHLGIGSRMIRETLAGLRTAAEPLVFLEGDPAYYSRFGFAPATELGFRKPSLRTPDAAFMVFGLGEARQALTGTLIYPDPFWRTDSVGLR